MRWRYPTESAPSIRLSPLACEDNVEQQPPRSPACHALAQRIACALRLMRHHHDVLQRRTVLSITDIAGMPIPYPYSFILHPYSYKHQYLLFSSLLTYPLYHNKLKFLQNQQSQRNEISISLCDKLAGDEQVCLLPPPSFSMLESSNTNGIF